MLNVQKVRKKRGCKNWWKRRGGGEKKSKRAREMDQKLKVGRGEVGSDREKLRELF